jgi:capsular polysaccharide biosynthesis protein
VNDPDQTMALRLGGDLRDRLAPYEDPADFDEGPAAESTTGLVSFGFIWAALRRRLLLWTTLAVAGLIIGCGIYVGSPPADKATTGIFLVSDPTHNSVTEVQTDIALAESLPVASAVVQQLGLQEAPSNFLANYTATGTTSQVLTITASASSNGEAVRRASAVATQFLKFRAGYMQTQQQQTATQLQEQITQAQQRVDSLSAQIKQLQSSGSGQGSDISRLKAQRTDAENALASVQQYATTTMASTETLTHQIIRGSQVLNQAVPVKNSFTKGVLIYGIAGLVVGLMIGLAIVVIEAITSDRLRRRDDIAYAIGAPVRLSVGPMRKARWVPGFRRSAGRRRDMERVVEHLRNLVPGSSRGPSCLAVVAVDDARTAAEAVVEFVVSNAKRKRIVVADLSAGAHAAHLLGVDQPGVSTISPSGNPVVVMVPAAEDIAPVGHLSSRSSRIHADEKVSSACSHADLVLSLVTLDPAFGGDHLATWATDATAIVTAGRSTATRVHAAGEMIRLAGVRLASVVVVDADASDESLGALSEEYQPATA